MLLSGKSLARYSLEAKDGSIGRVEDFYFDDDLWVIRYFVVNTNPWLPGEKKLLSPISVESVNVVDEVIKVDLMKEEIKNAPPMDTEKPVSRQQEREFYGYYGYGFYWPTIGMGTTNSLWGGSPFARDLISESNVEEDPFDERSGNEEENPHLRSLREMIGEFTGYDIAVTDGKVGHAEDFLMHDKSWEISSLVVDTKRYLPGDLVLVPKDKIQEISWEYGRIKVSMTKDEVQKAPVYDPKCGINEAEEERYHHSSYK